MDNKKIKTLWILIILMWLCLLSAEIVKIFSDIAYWILLGCWAMVVIAIIINNILIAIDFKRQEREYNLIVEDSKHLEELIIKYLAASSDGEEENKEDQE